MSTQARSRPAEDSLARRLMRSQLPVWLVVAVCLVVALCTWRVAVMFHNDVAPTGHILHGVVDSVDSDSDTICITGSLECYVAPGLGTKRGDEIAFGLERQPIDPDDPGRGNRLTMVWLSDGRTQL